MAETFATTPRAPLGVRLGAIVIGLLAVALATRTTITSLRWVDRTFPGFVLLDNRVIASIGLGHWPGARERGLYQSQVRAVDGVPVDSARAVYEAVARRGPGALVRYTLGWGATERDVAIEAITFTMRDWVLLFGAYLLNAVAYVTCGLVVWVLRPRAPLGRALLAFGCGGSLFMVTGMDLYGPATFFRLHVLGECAFSAVGYHLGLQFPSPHRWARYVWVPYAAALAVLLPYEAVLYQPVAYTVVHTAATWLLAGAGLFFGVRMVWEYWRDPTQLTRQRIRIVTVFAVVGFAVPGGIFLLDALTGGGAPVNMVAFTGFLFIVSVAYAVVKHDLFEIDAMVKRGAYYLLLTGSVGTAYVAAVVLFNLTLPVDVTASPAFPVAFTLIVLVVFNPLRSRLQAVVDRVFFRTTYDGSQELAAAGARLASALTRDDIAAIVRSAIDRAIPNTGTRVFVRVTPEGPMDEVGGPAQIHRSLVTALAAGRLVTVFDAQAEDANPVALETVRAALQSLGAELAVPMRLGQGLVGAMLVGEKRSRLFFTGGDAEFLRALGHQAAIALQNAGSYEALVALNASLEARVRERTAQLVQSEKMASLGRLVAGVAHEINNPVSFIATSIPALRRRLDKAKVQDGADREKVLKEADELVGIMARGAERTAAIVRDLRSFSRFQEADRKAVDLHEGLEVSIRLLESRWKDRITIHRQFGSLPSFECDAGQMNQVFMNLLANACDAMPERGTIWITTEASPDTVRIAVRDDGPGITPEVLGRIFDPFFTTKGVGQGTGLGLSITQGIVAAHDGRIEVTSEPGAGATFTIVLPRPTLDSAATDTR